MLKSTDKPKNEKQVIPSSLILCEVCQHRKNNSLFCTKGHSQDVSELCEDYGSFKVKLFSRTYDRQAKKMKEHFILSKCLNFTEMVALYRKFFKVRQDYNKTHKMREETKLLDQEKDVT